MGEKNAVGKKSNVWCDSEDSISLILVAGCSDGGLVSVWVETFGPSGAAGTRVLAQRTTQNPARQRGLSSQERMPPPSTRH